MCIAPDEYVEARVFDRLLGRGVSRVRAEAVARKVRRRYAAVRLERLQRLRESAQRARELDEEIWKSSKRP